MNIIKTLVLLVCMVILAVLAKAWDTHNINTITPDDSLKLSSIIIYCGSGQPITKEIHTEFWILRDKYPNEFKKLPDFNEALRLQKYIYNDALQSVKQNRLIISKERRMLEIEDESKTNDEFIQNIIYKKPLNINGQDIILNQENIKIILANLDVYFKNIEVNMENLSNRNAFR